MDAYQLSLDIIIPSFRVSLETLTPFLKVRHPGDMEVSIILIIDNPDKLLKVTQTDTITSGVKAFKKKLLEHSIGNLFYPESKLKVLCNKRNIGAANTRNVGLDNSDADYVLFLDDDVIPNENILFQYRAKLLELENEGTFEQVAGIMGPCVFPRSPTMPLKEAAFHVRNLAFIFEGPLNADYNWAQWGVTANLLVPRPKENSIRFDTSFDSPGGEDTDFCLALCEAGNGKRFHSLPSAKVTHPFWNGSVLDLLDHFFAWSLNDSKLFSKYPQFLLRSAPNLPETILLFVLPILLIFKKDILWAIWTVSVMFILNTIVDMVINNGFMQQNILMQLEQYQRPFSFYISAFFLGTLYVFVIECGTLYSHLKRFNFSNIGNRIYLNRKPDDEEEEPPAYMNKELGKFCGYIAILFLSRKFLF